MKRPLPVFQSMTADALLEFLEQKIQWLSAKKKREERYLERRRGRGYQTPTDDAYRADQSHEAELLAFLEHFQESVKKTNPSS